MSKDNFEPWWRRGDLATKNQKSHITTGPWQEQARKGVDRAEKFVGEVQGREPDSHYEWFRDVLVNWSWLYIERHFGFHYDEPEIAITIRLPWTIDYGTAPWLYKMSRSYVIVFGRVHTRLVKGAWHVRGGMSNWCRTKGHEVVPEEWL